MGSRGRGWVLAGRAGSVLGAWAGGEAGGGREQPQPGDRAGLGMKMGTGTGMGTGTRSLHWLSLEMMALPLQNGNSPLQKGLMTPNFVEQLKNVINSNY